LEHKPQKYHQKPLGKEQYGEEKEVDMYMDEEGYVMLCYAGDPIFKQGIIESHMSVYYVWILDRDCLKEVFVWKMMKWWVL